MSRIITISSFRILSFSVRNVTGIFKQSSLNSLIIPKSNINLCKNFCQAKVFADNVKLKVKRREDKSNTETFNDDQHYKPSDDPNVFGGQYVLSDDLEDEGDLKEEEYIKEISHEKKELVVYARNIKKLLSRNKVKEALDILEVEMKNDRVQPDKYIFNILISGCAKVGYARKAFKLFFKMKQHGLIPSGSTYTSLFNACANAPLKLDGFHKANRLREIMIENDFKPNEKNYNAMIKAYGRCNELSTAFNIVDEMIEKSIKLEASTFNFLLQACASDKDFGFRHALLTWHKMKNKSVAPDIYSFNTMLRCVKNCSIGDVETMKNVITNILSESTKVNERKQIDEPKVKAIIEPSNCKEKNVDVKDSEQVKEIVEPSDCKETNIDVKDSVQVSLTVSSSSIGTVLREDTPNLLSDAPHLGNLIEINEIQKPEDRLLLIGGLTGFLEEMSYNKVTPRLETFTSLLEVIPSTNAAEKKLISFIRKQGLKADIDFFNTLIKKRVMRMDYNGAKEVLNMIKTVKLTPDIFTYGILSLTCKTAEEARELIYNMKERDLRINIEILGAMLNQGCYNKDFPYITEIMQIALDEHIKPNEEFLKHLARLNQQCARLIDIGHRMAKSPQFQKNYKNFKENLHIWYEENGISGLQLEEQIKKIKESPYKKFKEKTKNDAIDYQKRNNIRKHIRKIKLDDLKGDDKLESLDKS